MTTANGMIVHISYTKSYRYEGHYFTYHEYTGVEYLRKDGHISQRVPKSFWPVADKFSKLTSAERDEFEVE